MRRKVTHLDSIAKPLGNASIVNICGKGEGGEERVVEGVNLMSLQFKGLIKMPANNEPSN